MLEVIISLLTGLVEKVIGNALESSEDRALVAKELYHLYALIVQALEAMEAVHSYLMRHHTVGISGPTGDTIVSCGKELQRIATEYVKHIRYSGRRPYASSLFRWSKEPRLDAKVIALFDDELAQALIDSLRAEVSVYDSLLKSPCFTGDSQGRITMTEVNLDELRHQISPPSYRRMLGLNMANVVQFKEFSMMDQTDVESLLSLFEAAIQALSDAQERLGGFIRQHYRIEDLL